MRTEVDKIRGGGVIFPDFSTGVTNDLFLYLNKCYFTSVKTEALQEYGIYRRNPTGRI